MSCNKVVLIDGQGPSRERMTHRLAENGFQVVGAAGSLIEARTAIAEGMLADLILLMLDHLGSDEAAASLQEVREQLAAAKFVIITAVGTTSLTRFCREVGINGCLIGDESTTTLMRSLSLIMIGQSIYPAPARVLMREGVTHHRREPGTNIRKSDATRNLSAVENQVLSTLLAGYSNKMIASHFRISEAAVKVHLKGLLRKLQAKNRTQAAVMAFENGYVDLGAPS